MESVWQLCRVRWHWLADLTLITTTPLSITLPSLHFSPPSHPFPHKFLLPFLWLYSYFPLAISYFPCLSSICLSLTTLSFLSNVFLGISTQGFFDSGHSEEPHQKWLVSHIFTLALSSLLHCFESETVILCSFCSCPPLIPSSLAYISRQPLSLPACLPPLFPLGIELLIAFSMWKSLTSFSFVRALQSNGMSGCCRGGIRIREYTGGHGVYLGRFE